MEDLFEPPPPMDTSHIKRKWLDIPYAEKSSAQKLDIYLPNTGDGPFPGPCNDPWRRMDVW